MMDHRSIPGNSFAPGALRHFALVILLLLSLATTGDGIVYTGEPLKAGKSASPAVPSFRQLGIEVLDRIDRDLKLGTLYAERVTEEGKKESDHGSFSFVWPLSFQLRALAAAARVAPRTYGKPLAVLADSIQRYWTVKGRIGGYAVLPGGSERYYDDNAWMLLGLLDTYDATRQAKYLSQAIRTLEFIASGEEKTEGGGIRQHEDKPGGIFTCTTAPAAVGALRIYRINRKPQYLQMAERWQAALDSPEIGLRDPSDGLYHQWAIKRAGGWHVEKGKRAYQSALPLEMNLLLHSVKKEKRYLEEAQRIAAASLRRWIGKRGELRETGQWGGSDLTDALLELYAVDGDRRWLEAVRTYLKFLHDEGRDPIGRYGEEWGESRKGTPLEKTSLLQMAAVARAYWRAAAYDGK